MYTTLQIKELIEDASEKAGSQRKLATMLGMEHSNLMKIKKGERPCNWRIRGALHVILGEEPARAFMAAVAEDLEDSENEDEKKAADGFKTILAAYPDDWRKRCPQQTP